MDDKGKAQPLANAQGQIELVSTSSSMLLETHDPYSSLEIMVDDMTDSSQAGMKVQPQIQPNSLLEPVPISKGESRNTSRLTVAERNEIRKAKRAERARKRYHNMPPEIRQQLNAKRAELLRMGRQRDEELCLLAETCQLETLDEQTRRSIVDAQMRRAKRAEQARTKYHSMNSEERRQYNAMRDAQRRQRTRELMEARQQLIMNAYMSTETAQTPHSLSPMSESMSSNDHGLSPGGAESSQIASSTHEIYQEAKFLHR